MNVGGLRVDLPAKCCAVLGSKARYKILRGGRGSAKSWSIARYLVVRATHQKLRILCTREMQNSIKDSVHRLLSDQIFELGLQDYFIILDKEIRGRNGTEFIFKGLKHNISGIRSTEGIDICWVEEAECVSDDSWTLLIPTLFRKSDSELLISYNPEEDGSATDKRFCKNLPPDSAWAEVNYIDNPWFPERLKELQEYDKRVDPEKWEHVWLGKYKGYADALIFKGKILVEDFETPENAELYFGSDFGFSNDPSVLVRMFIADRKLWIDYEAYGVGVEITDLHQFFASVPGADRWLITADSQRPDTISFLSQTHDARNGTTYPGYDIIGAEKGKGSVEDGIELLRSFEQIVIHPRCPNARDNFLNYKWKQDRITKAVLPVPAEGSDHVPDACRYALERYIKSKINVFDINYAEVDKHMGAFLRGER